MKQADKKRLLQKFREGTISAEERRKLDIAALDDDLLFEAMEGYYVEDERPGAVDDLRQKLYNRVTKKKRKKIIWIPTAVAAMIVLGIIAWWLNNDINTLGESPQITENIAIIEDAGVEVERDKEESNSSDEPEELNKIGQAPQVKAKPIFKEKELPKPENNLLQDDTPIPPPPAEEENEVFLGDLNTEYTPVEEYEAASASENETEVDRNRMEDNSDDIAEQAMDSPAADEKDTYSSKMESRASSAPASGMMKKAKKEIVFRTIKGKVVDINENPLIGASIIAEDYGGTTNFDGEFTLEIPQNISKINVSYTGYSSTEIFIPEGKTNKDLEIVLEEGAALSEVVVINNAMPKPEIGEDKFWTFVQNNKKIPKQAIENNISGVVSLTFDVSKKGVPQNFKILNTPGYGLSEEAIRLIIASGKWSPAGKRQLEITF